MILRDCTVILFGHRIHHWPVGLVLATLGAWLVWDDRKDLADWIIR